MLLLKWRRRNKNHISVGCARGCALPQCIRPPSICIHPPGDFPKDRLLAKYVNVLDSFGVAVVRCWQMANKKKNIMKRRKDTALELFITTQELASSLSLGGAWWIAHSFRLSERAICGRVAQETSKLKHLVIARCISHRGIGVFRFASVYHSIRDEYLKGQTSGGVCAQAISAKNHFSVSFGVGCKCFNYLLCGFPIKLGRNLTLKMLIWVNIRY